MSKLDDSTQKQTLEKADDGTEGDDDEYSDEKNRELWHKLTVWTPFVADFTRFFPQAQEE